MGGSESFAYFGSVIEFPPDPDDSTAKFWDTAPSEFKSMFRSRCLAAGLSVADDSRERFDFPIENKVFTIMTKYHFWRTDVALDPDRQKLWVRISEMLSEAWLSSSGENSEPQEIFEDYMRIPAFYDEIPIGRLLPTTHPEAHAATLEKLRDPDE